MSHGKRAAQRATLTAALAAAAAAVSAIPGGYALAGDATAAADARKPRTAAVAKASPAKAVTSSNRSGAAPAAQKPRKAQDPKARAADAGGTDYVDASRF